MQWNPSSTSNLTDIELRRLQRRFGHPSTESYTAYSNEPTSTVLVQKPGMHLQKSSAAANRVRYMLHNSVFSSSPCEKIGNLTTFSTITFLHWVWASTTRRWRIHQVPSRKIATNYVDKIALECTLNVLGRCLFGSAGHHYSWRW